MWDQSSWFENHKLSMFGFCTLEYYTSKRLIPTFALLTPTESENYVIYLAYFYWRLEVIFYKFTFSHKLSSRIDKENQPKITFKCELKKYQTFIRQKKETCRRMIKECKRYENWNFNFVRKIDCLCVVWFLCHKILITYTMEVIQRDIANYNF